MGANCFHPLTLPTERDPLLREVRQDCLNQYQSRGIYAGDIPDDRLLYHCDTTAESLYLESHCAVEQDRSAFPREHHHVRSDEVPMQRVGQNAAIRHQGTQ